jgi:hypothetical protein
MTDVTRDERAELHAALGRIEALLIEIAGRPPAPRLTIAELAPAEPKPARPVITIAGTAPAPKTAPRLAPGIPLRPVQHR